MTPLHCHRLETCRRELVPESEGAKVWRRDSVQSAKDVARVIRNITGAMAGAGFPDEEIFRVRLALDEAVVNAHKHGHDGDWSKPVAIRYHVSEEGVVAEIEDQGPGFDPKQVPDPLAPENLERPSGADCSSCGPTCRGSATTRGAIRSASANTEPALPPVRQIAGGAPGSGTGDVLARRARSSIRGGRPQSARRLWPKSIGDGKRGSSPPQRGSSRERAWRFLPTTKPYPHSIRFSAEPTLPCLFPPNVLSSKHLHRIVEASPSCARNCGSWPARSRAERSPSPSTPPSGRRRRWCAKPSSASSATPCPAAPSSTSSPAPASSASKPSAAAPPASSSSNATSGSPPSWNVTSPTSASAAPRASPDPTSTAGSNDGGRPPNLSSFS